MLSVSNPEAEEKLPQDADLKSPSEEEDIIFSDDEYEHNFGDLESDHDDEGRTAGRETNSTDNSNLQIIATPS